MTQLTFLPSEPGPDSKAPTIPRPIHYLGSKLRILDEIVDHVMSVQKEPGHVCDLFAGCGSVASALARRGPVTAVDIQEYSRVLCSALLGPQRLSNETIQAFRLDRNADQLGQALSWSMEPLSDLEEDLIAEASAGHPEPLCELLECGPVVVWQLDAAGDVSAPIRDASKECLRRLQEAGLDSSSDSLVSRYFGGVYFSYRQAVDLDVILARIAETPHGARDVLVAAVLSTASDLVNTVGKHFAQPIRPRHKDGRPKRGLGLRLHRDRAQDTLTTYLAWLKRFSALSATPGPNYAVRMDYRTFLENWHNPVTAFYADPPYTRDHYSRYYHVLETLSLRDTPDVTTSNLGAGKRRSRGVYRRDRHQSPFCIKSQAPLAFEQLFSLSRRFGAPLVLSYSPYDSNTRARPRVMSIDQVRQLAERHYSKVLVRPVGSLNHSKLNKRELNTGAPEQAELVVVCRP